MCNTCNKDLHHQHLGWLYPTYSNISAWSKAMQYSAMCRYGNTKIRNMKEHTEMIRVEHLCIVLAKIMTDYAMTVVTLVTV